MAGDAVVLGRGHLDLGDDGQRRATGRRGDGRQGDEEVAGHGNREGVGAGEHGSLAPLLFTSLSLSPAQRRLRYDLILSAVLRRLKA